MCETIPIDSLLEALADEQRRHVLAYLSDTPDGVASAGELADHVKQHSSDAHDPERIVVRLHHVVLPELDELGLLDYDPRSDMVRYRPKPRLETLLEYLEGREW